jgi:hypothetical protein
MQTQASRHDRRCWRMTGRQPIAEVTYYVTKVARSPAYGPQAFAVPSQPGLFPFMSENRREPPWHESAITWISQRFLGMASMDAAQPLC